MLSVRLYQSFQFTCINDDSGTVCRGGCRLVSTATRDKTSPPGELLNANIIRTNKTPLKFCTAFWIGSKIQTWSKMTVQDISLLNWILQVSSPAPDLAQVLPKNIYQPIWKQCKTEIFKAFDYRPELLPLKSILFSNGATRKRFLLLVNAMIN